MRAARAMFFSCCFCCCYDGLRFLLQLNDPKRAMYFFPVIYGMKFYEVVIFGLVWLGLVATITVNPRLYFQEIKA